MVSHVKGYLVMEELCLVGRGELASKQEKGTCRGDGDLVR